MLDNLFIANRTFERAEKLVATIDISRKIAIKASTLDDFSHIDCPIDLLINTTSVGMGTLKEQSPTKITQKISKSLIVTSNAKRKRIILKIVGNVLAANKPANSLEKPKSILSAK